MNFATILIVLILAALVGLAVRYLVKNGPCAACENRAACRAAKKAEGKPSAGCEGNCSACRFYETEKKARQTGAAGRP